jgi:hypothetical protein
MNLGAFLLLTAAWLGLARRRARARRARRPQRPAWLDGHDVLSDLWDDTH